MILLMHDLLESAFLADTLDVMSRSPSRILVRREFELRRPRDLELTCTPQFTDIVHELRGCIGAIRQAVPWRAGSRDEPVDRTLDADAAAARRAAAVANDRQPVRGSDFIFSSSVRIAKMMWLHAGTIAAHAWRTCWVTLVGFGIATAVGVLLGFLMGSSQLAYRAMYPLMTGFNALPKPALVPIPVVRFGIGVGPAVRPVFLIAFFPIMVNIATGLATLKPELDDVLRVLGARR